MSRPGPGEAAPLGPAASPIRISQAGTGLQACCEVDNGRGLVLGFSALGAALRSCRWQGRELTLGLANPDWYQKSGAYLGVTVGRYANRLAKARCRLGGELISLDRNDGENHLHGGFDGFNIRLWQGEPLSGSLLDPTGRREELGGMRYRLTSPSGDQGYPGTLQVEVDLLVSTGNHLVMAYRGVSDADTPLNLTNHAYWNLAGESSGTVHAHELRLRAAGWLAVDRGGIPDGELKPMADSAWDFRDYRSLGPVLDAARPASGQGVWGLDHNFVVDPKQAAESWVLHANGLRQEARLREAASLRLPGQSCMQVFTSQPGVQVYTGNHLGGKGGRQGAFERHGAICLETQYFPDSPNQAERFRAIGRELGYEADELEAWDGLSRAGQLWEAMTIHRFS